MVDSRVVQGTTRRCGKWFVARNSTNIMSMDGIVVVVEANASMRQRAFDEVGPLEESRNEGDKSGNGSNIYQMDLARESVVDETVAVRKMPTSGVAGRNDGITQAV